MANYKTSKFKAPMKRQFSQQIHLEPSEKPKLTPQRSPSITEWQLRMQYSQRRDFTKVSPDFPFFYTHRSMKLVPVQNFNDCVVMQASTE